MGAKFCIIFKSIKPTDRWAAHIGGLNRRDIEIPGNWWAVPPEIGGPFHFEDILRDPSLLNLLSSDDRIRFVAAEKVYNNVIQGVGYFGEDDQDDRPTDTAIERYLPL